jgi:predicted kinase
MKIAVENMSSPDAGATVWWAMSGSVSLDKLREAWLIQGLDVSWLPSPPSPDQRLGRAVRAVTEQRVLARPLTRRGSYAIVVEELLTSVSADDAKLRHEQRLSVRVCNDALLFSEQNKLSDTILREFDALRDVLDSNDIAEWLSEDVLRQRLHGTKLRPRGGVYYVLPSACATWRRVCAALEWCQIGQCYTLPTLNGADATRAVLDALTRDVGDDVDEVYAQIAKGVGKRALAARVDDCNGLLARLEQYEGLLGGALQSVRDRVAAVQDAAMVAAMQIEAAALPPEE